jgi:HEAT repeat protein
MSSAAARARPGSQRRRRFAPRCAALIAALLGTLLATGLGGCDRAPSGPPAPRALEPVVTRQLAELDAALAAEDQQIETWSQPADAATQRQVLGLLELVAGSRDPLRRTGLEDLGRIGSAAVGLLEEVLRSPDTSEPGLFAASDALWVIGNGGFEERPAPLEEDPQARARRRFVVETLGRVLVHSRSAPQRARAAWHLGRLGLDQALPILCLRLKYETDSETVLWLAWALARFQNYAGLTGLEVIAANPGDPQAAAAAGMLQTLADSAGMGSGGLLGWTWTRGDPEGRIQVPAPSLALQREYWRRLQVFEQYQLRGVDDSRFIFERSDARVSPLLALALHDQDVHVRYHAAQSLGRMGRRGALGAAALIEALRRPDTAAVVAEALGQLGAEQGREALEARLGAEQSLELRVAAARGLARLGLAASQPALRRQFELPELPAELRLALAEALVYVQDDRGALEVLSAAWGDADYEQRPIEAALGFALGRRAAAGEADFAVRFEAWQAAADLPEAERVLQRRPMLAGL